MNIFVDNLKKNSNLEIEVNRSNPAFMELHRRYQATR